MFIQRNGQKTPVGIVYHNGHILSKLAGLVNIKQIILNIQRLQKSTDKFIMDW